MREIIGWIGGLSLAFCAVPQVIKTIKTKSARDLSYGFLNLWLLGEICAVIYITENLPLFLNYCANIVFISIIYYYKIRQEVKK